MLFCFYPLVFGNVWPTYTLFRGYIALAIPSLPETDPQNLEHLCYVEGKSFQTMDFGYECHHDVRRLHWTEHKGLVSVCLHSSSNFGSLEQRWWGSPRQISQSKRFWSRMYAWRATAFVNFTRWIGLCMFVLFRRMDIGGSMSWNAQPNCRVLFNMVTARLFINLAKHCPLDSHCHDQEFLVNAVLFPDSWPRRLCFWLLFTIVFKSVIFKSCFLLMNLHTLKFQYGLELPKLSYS